MTRGGLPEQPEVDAGELHDDQVDGSIDRVQAMTLAAANKLLWSGCAHGPYANTCSLDGKGWVSTTEFVMAGCDAAWYHLGGEFTGNCGGHDGDKIRRLALTQNDCYDY